MVSLSTSQTRDWPAVGGTFAFVPVGRVCNVHISLELASAEALSNQNSLLGPEADTILYRHATSIRLISDFLPFSFLIAYI